MNNNICLALTYPQQCTIFLIYSYTVYFVCLPLYQGRVLQESNGKQLLSSLIHSSTKPKYFDHQD